ncbi:MAG: hypothetical protein NTY88_13300 [Bacteroidetes bacterium]|nr:hypothetical protein [Bacteroidota bacterium]
MNTKVLSVQQKDNLAVVQFSTIPNNTLEIVSSTFALKNNLIEVKEISDGGSVNELLVLNHSEKFVFLMDGDILDGAKQNRVLNTSVLLAPQSKTKIPVSCVESGRWNYKSKNFQSTDYVAPANLRANKSMKVAYSFDMKQGHKSDQSEVWDNVSDYSAKLGVSSASSNLSDVFDGSQNSYQKFLDSFTHHPEANGVAFFVNKKPLALDIFNRTDIMHEYFPKLLKGVAMDVYGMKNEMGEMTEAEASFKALDFMDMLETLERKQHPGVALGTEKRFNSETVSGFELNYNNQLVHLTALSLTNKKS